jgi:starch synthase (maltosyl-transferring)
LPRSSSSPNNAAAAPARVVIESVRPEVDCGRYAIKRVLGESVEVHADVFADGHDAVVAVLLWKHEEDAGWRTQPMEYRHNDHWVGSFRVEKLGRYQYSVRGWTDPFLTWQRDLKKRQDAGQDIKIDLQIGSNLLGSKIPTYEEAMAAVSPPPAPERTGEYGRALEVVVDPVKARFSTWYETFPRSARADGTHASFRDLIELLPYVEQMGFDVLYLPPIHPIGATARKGRNNAVAAEPGDVGSPWAIGAKEGGHKAIHPLLGSFSDFESLVREAKKRDIDIALDIAFQCSPDHPYVKAHPQWFRWRPDGTVQYAENPPKKYQDIYPFEFESPEWKSLWEELKSVFEFWVSHGVKIFRVDNPHTKAFPFWEWCIAELKKQHPELIFLSEAFTRPRIMHRLSKLGFTQSYTYFTWRNTKQELTEYFTELSQDPSREYFRPNCWPNTPDILHEYLQHGGRPAFIVRLVLAGTLAANYGMYGPAFELCEHAPREPGSEEYLFSEKYEVKRWDRSRPDSLKELVGKLNAVRKQNAALQSDWSLRFHPIDNGQMIAYSKWADGNQMLMVVNLDPHHVHSGWLDFGAPGQVYDLHDLLSGGRYTWNGGRNYVELNPHTLPAHVFRVHRRA